MREKYCWIIDKFRPQVNVLVWRKLGCSTLQVATKASMACGVLPFLVSCVSRRRRASLPSRQQLSAALDYSPARRTDEVRLGLVGQTKVQ
jgi:hypothetical protein